MVNYNINNGHVIKKLNTLIKLIMNTLKKICEEMKMTEINTLKKENIKFKEKTEIKEIFSKL